jgi:hypothetical protein
MIRATIISDKPLDARRILDDNNIPWIGRYSALDAQILHEDQLRDILVQLNDHDPTARLFVDIFLVELTYNGQLMFDYTKMPEASFNINNLTDVEVMPCQGGLISWTYNGIKELPEIMEILDRNELLWKQVLTRFGKSST